MTGNMLGLEQRDHRHDDYVTGKWETSQQYNNQHQQKYSAKQETPQLLSINPDEGKEGTMITIVLQDLSPQHVKLAFNSLVVDTKQLQQENGKSTTTTLISAIPNFQTTFCTTQTVPISVCYFDDDDIILDTFLVANFTYQRDGNTTPTITQKQQSHQNGRKRSYSYLANDSHSTNLNKRAYQTTTPNQSIVLSYSNALYSSYPQYLPDDQNGNHSTSSQSIQKQQQSQLSYSPSPPKTMTIPSSNLQQQEKSQRRPSVQNLKSTSHQPSTPVANYQPYPGLINQSNFELITDLDTMMQNWTVMERIQGRRLVRFWREDGPDNLNQCGCQPISQNDSAATDINNTVVSCIYWPEKDDYYITSVDAIYLLESLMKIHFGVEEKNRIRRNLEGFRPMTVAKCKPISAQLFKLIMSFPNPKPRNIEKDIKAFTWKVLPYALKKIITKYAIASSTTTLKDWLGHCPSSLTSSSTSISQQQLPYQGNTTLTSPHSSMFLPPTSFGSSMSPDSMTKSLSSQSPLSTPPSVEDGHHHQYQHNHMSNKQQLYYNPTTMTYGSHQEPGIRAVNQLESCFQTSQSPIPAPSPPLSSAESPSPPILLRSEPLLSNGMTVSFTTTTTTSPLYPYSTTINTLGNTDDFNDTMTSIPTLTSVSLPPSSTSAKYVPQLFMDENTSLE